MNFFLENIYSRGLKFLQVIYENFDCDLTHGFLSRISINIFFMMKIFLLWFNTRVFLFMISINIYFTINFLLQLNTRIFYS